MTGLREVREKSGMSQTEAARHLGISRQTYASYEENIGAVRIWRAEQIANLFEISLGDIFEMCRTEQDDLIDSIINDVVDVLTEYGIDEESAVKIANRIRRPISEMIDSRSAPNDGNAARFQPSKEME